MMKYAIRSCMILSVFCVLMYGLYPGTAPAASKAKKAAPPADLPLIGLKYGPGVPKGYEDLGGGVMADERHVLTEFGLQYVRGKKGEMIWLCRVTGTDPSGKHTFQIVDVLELPQRQKNEIVAWFACFFNGRRNEQIVAYTDQYYFKVRRAWYADRQTGKIREVSPGGIVCADPASQ